MVGVRHKFRVVRVTALILAFLMGFCYYPAMIGSVEVFAAPGDIRIRPEETMKVNPSSFTPNDFDTLAELDRKDPKALGFEWTLGQPSTINANELVFVLPIDDNVVVRVEIKNYYESSINKFLLDLSINFYTTYSAALDGTGNPITGSKYTVYNPTSSTYVTVSNLINDMFGGDGRHLNETSNHPHMTLTANTGFSLMYNGYNIHALWINGVLKFSITAPVVNRGRIYEFHFFDQASGPIDPAVNPGTTHYYINGLDMSTFSAIPYAKDYIYDPPGAQPDRDTKYATPYPPDDHWFGSKNDHALLHQDADGNDYKNETTNNNENAVQITFDLPMAFNGNSFNKSLYSIAEDIALAPAGTPVIQTFDFYFTFNLDLGSHVVETNDLIDEFIKSINNGEKRIGTKNISSPYLRDINDDTTGDYISVAGSNNNTISFTFLDLPASTIYNDALLTFTPSLKPEYWSKVNTPAAKDVPRIPPYRIYTYLGYHIEYYDEVYQAVFEPYAGHEGTYLLTTASTFLGSKLENTRPEDRYYQTSNGLATMRLPFSSSEIRSFHRIYFIPKDYPEQLEQQPFSVKPSDSDYVIGRPRNFKILNDVHEPLDPVPDPNPNRGVLNMTLQWDIASPVTLQKMFQENGGSAILVDYVINSVLGEVSTTEVMKLTLSLELVPTIDGNGQQYSKLVAGVVSFDPSDVLVPPVTLVNDNFEFLLENNIWLSVRIPVQVHTKRSATEDGGYGAMFDFPNVYRLFVSLIRNAIEVNRSNEADLILDDFSKLDLRQPQNFVFEETNWWENKQTVDIDGNPIPDVVSAQFSFTAPHKRILEYAKEQQKLLKSDTSVGQLFETAEPVATFTLILCQNEDLMREFSDFMAARTDKDKYNGGLPAYTDGRPVLYLCDPSVLQRSGNTYTLDPATLNELRNGEIIAICDLPQDAVEILKKFGVMDAEGYYVSVTDGYLNGSDMLDFPLEDEFYTLSGLDKNQKYYAAMFTTLSFFSMEKGDFIGEYYSDLTGIIAITTSGDIIEPDPNEKPPGNPRFDLKTLEDHDYGDTWANLYWNNVKTDEERIDYEVIRTTTRLEPEALDERLPFPDFFGRYVDQSDKFKEIFRFFASGIQDFYVGEIKYNTTSIKALDIHEFMLADEPLVPNLIYYYYVRAVKISMGNEVSYSVWDEISITTEVVMGPDNLRVLPPSGGFDYDPLTEAVIQFDAPLQYGYTYWLSVREGAAGWSEPIQMPLGALLENPKPLGDDRDFYTFTFRITGLKPNSGYSFRVMLKDSNNYPSSWSNTAETRTDFDQGEYDGLHDLSSWLEFLKKNLRDEFKDNYWTLSESTSQAEILMRYSMFDSLEAFTVGSQIFVYDKPVDRLVLYIPSYAVNQANLHNLSFVVRNGRLETIIPPNALTEATTGITSALDDIKYGKAEDWYVRVTLVYQKQSRNYADDFELAERQCQLAVDAVSAKKSAKSMDKESMTVIFNKLNDETFYNDARNKIKEMLEQDAINTELASFVYGYVAAKKAGLMAEARGLLTASITASYTIAGFDIPVMHAYLSEDSQSLVRGYYYNGGSNYTQAATTQYKGGQVIRTSGPHTFLFTISSAASVVEGLFDAVDFPGDMSALISKYGLTDYVGGDKAKLEGAATVKDAMGIIARIAGAAVDAEPVSWLIAKGYSVSGKTSASVLTKQEAMYLVMALYEIKSGVSIVNMRISDFTATAGFSGIDAKYLRSIQAAYELEVWDDPELIPKETATVGDLLNMISRLAAKIGL